MSKKQHFNSFWLSILVALGALLICFISDIPYTYFDIKQPTTPPDRQGHIVDLFENGTINIKAQGLSIEELSISIENLYERKAIVEIPLGTYFVPHDSSAQNMVVTKSQVVTLWPGETQELIINVACASIHQDIPSTDDTFAVQKSDSEDLDRLLRALEDEQAYYQIKQAAIWIVTDNADYEGLGRLVGNSPNLLGLTNYRIIGVREAAKAMQIIDEAGIDITSRRIWRDREFIADRADNKFFSEWVRERESQIIIIADTPTVQAEKEKILVVVEGGGGYLEQKDIQQALLLGIPWQDMHEDLSFDALIEFSFEIGGTQVDAHLERYDWVKAIEILTNSDYYMSPIIVVYSYEDEKLSEIALVIEGALQKLDFRTTLSGCDLEQTCREAYQEAIESDEAVLWVRRP